MAESEAVGPTAELVSVAVGKLTPTDVGSRVVTLESGALVEGRLTQILAMRMSFSGQVSLSIEITTEAGHELKLKAVPLDYIIQIERPTE